MLSNIPFYDLYGETFFEKGPGLAHVENIAYRSQGLGWEIAPHRHDKLTQIICTFDDSWEVQLDQEKYQLSGNWLVLIPPGVVHGFVFQPNVRGFVVSLNEEILYKVAAKEQDVKLPDLIWSPQIIEFRDEQQVLRFSRYIDLLNEELKGTDPEQEIAVNQLVQLILLTVKRQQHLAALNAGVAGAASKTLLAFRHLIEKHYLEHLSLAEYAGKLHVSASTLNRLCQSTLKQSPKAFIHQRLLIEAKRRLIYTRQSVEEIAFTLGFKDPGYFSRFFKQLEGVSAGQFRRLNG